MSSKFDSLNDTFNTDDSIEVDAIVKAEDTDIQKGQTRENDVRPIKTSTPSSTKVLTKGSNTSSSPSTSLLSKGSNTSSSPSTSVLQKTTTKPSTPVRPVRSV